MIRRQAIVIAAMLTFFSTLAAPRQSYAAVAAPASVVATKGKGVSFKNSNNAIVKAIGTLFGLLSKLLIGVALVIFCAAGIKFMQGQSGAGIGLIVAGTIVAGFVKILRIFYIIG